MFYSFYFYCLGKLFLFRAVARNIMVIIVPYSLDRKKEVVQGEGEEQARDQRKGGQKKPATSAADVPIGLFWSGALDVIGTEKI